MTFLIIFSKKPDFLKKTGAICLPAIAAWATEGAARI
jgi:hypothetical protein